MIPTGRSCLAPRPRLTEYRYELSRIGYWLLVIGKARRLNRIRFLQGGRVDDPAGTHEGERSEPSGTAT